MEPILSNLAAGTGRNTPRDLQSRLYREIGISAVAAALEAGESRADATSVRRGRPVRKAA